MIMSIVYVVDNAPNNPFQLDFQTRIINTPGLTNDVSPADGHDTADFTDKCEAFPRKSPLVPCWLDWAEFGPTAGRTGLFQGTKSETPYMISIK
jgi:hypothetical protein